VKATPSKLHERGVGQLTRRSSLRTYLDIIRASAREDSANARRLVAGVAVSVIRVGLIAAIYKVAYAHSAARTSLPYANALWSIAAYFAFILNLGIRNVFKIVDREVRTGVVEVGVIKPIDWRLYKICELLGKNGLEFLAQLIVLPIALLIFVGAPDMSHLTFLDSAAFVLLTLLAMIVASAMFLTVGLAAFWLQDAQPVYRILDKLTLVFGGAFVPIALLPHATQILVRYSPFGVYAAPTQLFNPQILPSLGPMVLAAVAWSAFLVFLCDRVWQRAMSKIEVNGG